MPEPVKKYIVSAIHYEYDEPLTKDKAIEKARKSAYRNGDEYGVYELILVAEKPEELNNVKVIPYKE